MKQKVYNPIKAQRAAHRQALIDNGLHGRFKQKAIVSAKAYKRKQKHRGAKLEG